MGHLIPGTSVWVACSPHEKVDDPEECSHAPRFHYVNEGEDAKGPFRIVSCLACETIIHPRE